MGLRVGFAETAITPPLGTQKIGWIIRIISDRVLDDLCARVAVFESDGGAIALVNLDTLSIRWTTANEIRRRISSRYGFPGAQIMVAGTHNHAGPAISGLGEDTRRDDAYVETLTERVVATFGAALANRQDAEIGLASGFEFDVSHNRRIIMRDGTVKTLHSFNDPQALCLEGPIDPEVAVLAARSRAGQPLGLIVNFACHPVHHGGTTELSGGYPGVLGREMRQRGWPVTLFLNGACGNLQDADLCRGGKSKSKEEIGAILAADAEVIVKKLTFSDAAALRARSTTIQLPYRRLTKAQISGTARGVQRFVDPGAYDRAMPALIERIRTRKTQPAEVQVLSVNDWDFAAIPAEFFVQNGLKIKEQSHPRHALVVSIANGMVGYVPHREAFRRGGYETTFGPGSRLAPEAGDMLVDAAVALICGERSADRLPCESEGGHAVVTEL